MIESRSYDAEPFTVFFRGLGNTEVWSSSLLPSTRRHQLNQAARSASASSMDKITKAGRSPTPRWGQAMAATPRSPRRLRFRIAGVGARHHRTGAR